MYSLTINTATMQQGLELFALVSWCVNSSLQYAGRTVPQPFWVKLSARPRRGNKRDACTKRYAHRRMSSAEMFTRDPRQKFRRIQHTLRPCSKFVEILLNSFDFLSTGWSSFEGQVPANRCSQYFSSWKHYLGFFRWCSEFKEFRHINMFKIYLGIFRCI